MPTDTTYTVEYLTYLERRYNDLKEIYEAVASYYDPDLYEENHAFTTLLCEFNYLAGILGFEDEAAFLDRLCADCDESDTQ